MGSTRQAGAKGTDHPAGMVQAGADLMLPPVAGSVEDSQVVGEAVVEEISIPGAPCTMVVSMAGVGPYRATLKTASLARVGMEVQTGA